MKVAVAPESVPRHGARAALEIPLISVEVHHSNSWQNGSPQVRRGWSSIRLFDDCTERINGPILPAPLVTEEFA